MGHVFLGDTPLTRCRYYRQVCDLPARIDPPELGRIVMPAGHTWALMMPSALGFAVKKDLQRGHDHNAGTGAGPIISHIRSGRWSFLIRPDLPDDTALFAEMFGSTSPSSAPAPPSPSPPPPTAANSSAAGSNPHAAPSAPRVVS
ncbi:DNA-directed RNA polymerase subunit beta [Nocardia sienata]|uniref:DNA-directed RNA polymerase subunit beta n=1 Tax=Nocardia sienata TaxID=248552 RepID=UPI000ADC9338|nr:DNA-directed RNA polymerase subunit beta [Nocardia sienata]